MVAVGLLVAFLLWPGVAIPYYPSPACSDNKSAAELTILFFTAPWCGPCRPVKTVLDEFSQAHGETVKLIPIDIDESKAEAERWGVGEIPVVIALSHEGELLLRQQGGDPPAVRALKRALEDLLKRSRRRRDQ